MKQPLQILIVDDEPLARTRLIQLLGDCQTELPNSVLGEAGCSHKALSHPELAAVDVVLLDIDMPGEDGLVCARQLAALDKPPAVIFVTAHPEHALAAFEVSALDYLLKPVRRSRLVQALRRLQSPSTELDAYFTVNDRDRVIRVALAQVLYLRSELKYITLRTRETEFVLSESLSQIEHKFPQDLLRIHRNCLVNRSQLLGFELRAAENRWFAVLRDWPEHLPVSRRQTSVVQAYRHPSCQA